MFHGRARAFQHLISFHRLAELDVSGSVVSPLEI
jgi:hypothetical protein